MRCEDRDQMTPEQRIHELTTRQVYYGSSMVCKLNAVNSKWTYSIWAWKNQDNQDIKFIVKMGKYNHEDPNELFQVALSELGLKGIKLGKPVNKDSFLSSNVHSKGLRT